MKTLSPRMGAAWAMVENQVRVLNVILYNFEN